MDSERTLLVVAVGLAFAVGCYVLWGPGALRSKRRKGQVIGLVNLGHTCFLNTLLQALASCPTFLEWLLQNEEKDDMSLISSLRTVLLALNGEVPDIFDPYPPTEVISALRKHHWVISPGEQDAHELFHVLLETLEDESSSSTGKNGSISDILLPQCSQLKDALQASCAVSQKGLDMGHGDESCSTFSGAIGQSFSRSIRRTGKIMLSPMPLPSPLPFRGMLTSQLKCTLCGFKSALRFDKFDTLSLPLPASRIIGQQLTLQILLDNFVKTEVVKDVTCDNCSRGSDGQIRTTSLKTLNFGKLPKCLCLHIVRTTWNSDGSLRKREDYVDFPEFLVMDTYTHRQSVIKEGDKLHFLQDKDVNFDIGKQSNGNAIVKTSKLTEVNSRPKHMYRLKAVVVHIGDIHSGHFVTYRKGPIKSLFRHRPLSLESKIGSSGGLLESSRWFYTSDTIVQQATLCQALLSNAYMLFYEKCLV